MANWNRSYITNAGLELIAQSQAQGRALNVTTLKTSSHDYSGSTEAELKELTSLSDIVQTFQVDNKESIGSEVKLSATLTNEGLVNSYVFNAYGIYANIGSSDVLMFVAVCENPDTIPVPSSSLWQSIINSYLQISNDVEITLNVDYSANATMEWVKENKLINVTYSELKGLRDNSQLVAGQQYRITDYETIINGDVTYNGTTKTLYRSAGHPFDLIVVADSENVLNENARAIQHSGDTYFTNSDLSAWKIKYCIDNDTSRFNWAISSGKGIIYELIDDKNNSCGYDFKNIQMKVFKVTANTKQSYRVGNYNSILRHTLFDFAPVNSNDTIDESDFKWCYTFNLSTDNYATCQDNSILSKNVFGNKFTGTRKDNNLILHLFCNVVLHIASTDYINSCGSDFCIYLNEFIGNHYGVSFGNNCYANSVGDAFNNCLFGPNCYSNSFGTNCNDNSFATACHNNSFGSNCHSNSFGNSCSGITLGDNCSNNKTCNSVSNITLGSQCHGNFIQNGCNTLTFNNNTVYVSVIRGNKTNTTFTTAQNYSVITS